MRPLFAAALFSAFVLIVGGAFIGRDAAVRFTDRSAHAAVERWVSRLTDDAVNVGRAVEGVGVSSDPFQPLRRAVDRGEITRFGVFDPLGRPIAAQGVARGAAGTHASLGDPDLAERIARALRSVAPIIHLRDAPDGGARAEAAVPILEDERVVGVVALTVDQSGDAAFLRAEALAIGLRVLGLIVFALSFPLAVHLASLRSHSRAVERLRRAETRDALTTLMNRRAFVATLDGMLAASAPATPPLPPAPDRAASDAPIAPLIDQGGVALITLNLDGFKAVNEANGAVVGDRLLEQLGQRLAQFAPSAVVGRLGGDEFGVVKRVDSEREALALSEALVGTVCRAFQISGRRVSVGASAGVAYGAAAGSDAPAVVTAAAMALREAKRIGGGGVVQYSKRLEEELRSRYALEERLRDAVAAGDFQLHFQPVFAAGGGALVGFEALVRLDDDHGAPIPPAVFIAVAEELGLICDIGEWVLQNACATAAAWPAPLSVSVNLTADDLTRPALCDRVRAALEASGLAPERLEIEVTESMLIAEAGGARATLEGLKELGVSLALDDFGVGYSSLGHLWRYPFDKLKIDRSFVQGLAEGGESATALEMLGAIVALGRALGVKITAEGVETEEQDRLIAEIGCDLVQGYFRGKPTADVERYLPIDGVEAATIAAA